MDYRIGRLWVGWISTRELPRSIVALRYALAG